MPMDEAMRRLQGTLIGSHENALAFGVVINENTLKAELAAQGWDKLTGAELEAAKVQARINLLMKGTTDAQGDAARTSGGWANQMRKVTSSISEAATEMGLKLLPVFEPVIQKISDLASQYLPILIDAFSNYVIPVVQSVVDAFSKFFGHLAGGQSFLAAFRSLLIDLVPPEFMGKVNEVINTVVSLADTIGTFVAAHLEEFKGALIGIGVVLAGAAIVAGIAAVAGAIAALASPIGIIIAVAAILGAAWAGNWGDIQGKTQAVVDWFKNTAIPWIKTSFDYITEVLLPQLSAIWSNIWSVIEKVISFVFSNIQSYVEAFTAAFNGDWYTFGAKLREVWDRNWALIKSLFVAAKDFIVSKAKDAWNSIVSSVKNIDWSSVGRSITDGIASGISRGASSITNAARRAARNALEAAKGFLGISSPSKVFMEVGDNMMLGWEKQIVARTPSLSGVVQDAASQVSSVVSTAVPSNQAATSGGVNVYLTYSPMFSTADEVEIETKLMPLIRSKLRG